jgi:hypothetical protein
MAIDDDEDYEPHGLPLALYLIVGVLAVIGLFSIMGAVMGAVFWLVKLAVAVLVVAAAVWLLKAVFFGQPPPRRHLTVPVDRRSAGRSAAEVGPDGGLDAGQRVGHGALLAEALDERDDLESGGDVVEHLPDHRQHRHLELAGQVHDTTHDLALERLAVEEALTGDDQVGAPAPASCTSSATTSNPDTIWAPMAQAPGQPAGGPSPGRVTRILNCSW